MWPIRIYRPPHQKGDFQLGQSPRHIMLLVGEPSCVLQCWDFTDELPDRQQVVTFAEQLQCFCSANIRPSRSKSLRGPIQNWMGVSLRPIVSAAIINHHAGTNLTQTRNFHNSPGSNRANKARCVLSVMCDSFWKGKTSCFTAVYRHSWMQQVHVHPLELEMFDNMSASQRIQPIVQTRGSSVTEYQLVSVQ